MSTSKHGSVQDLLPLEEIVDGVLCLRGGDYRAVLQAQSVNFALKSEDEQEAVLAGYRAFLNGLSHPLQVLVRILPTNVEPYLAGFRGNVLARGNSEAIRRLARDHETFVRGLARERTLLERRFYVVVPAEEHDAAMSLAWPWKRTRRRHEERRVAVAAAQLNARCQEVTQGLLAFGVSSRRLESEALAELWAACLCAQVTSIAPSLVAGARPVVAGRPQGGAHHG